MHIIVIITGAQHERGGADAAAAGRDRFTEYNKHLLSYIICILS
jgi:hypothetical protein